MTDINATLMWKLLVASGLASLLTGNDLLALLFAIAGALSAMTKQQPVGPVRQSCALFGVVFLAVATAWFAAEAMPFATQHLVDQPYELNKGRALISWLVAYYAQDSILPVLPVVFGQVWRRLLAFFGGKNDA